MQRKALTWNLWVSTSTHITQAYATQVVQTQRMQHIEPILFVTQETQPSANSTAQLSYCAQISCPTVTCFHVRCVSVYMHTFSPLRMLRALQDSGNQLAVALWKYTLQIRITVYCHYELSIHITLIGHIWDLVLGISELKITQQL